MSACAPTALRPLCFIFVAQVGLVLLLKVRWLLIFPCLKCLSQSVDHFDDLLALSITMGCTTTFDILVPVCISKAYLAFHALFKLLSGLSTAFKLRVVLLEIILVKARWALIFIHMLLLISFIPFVLINLRFRRL